MSTLDGRCLCGNITYEIDGEPNWCGHCHCDSCRRNCSAAYVTFIGVDRDKHRWTSEPPATYVSSPGVRRHFCPKCGSPMAFDADHYPEEIHLYAACLNDPNAVQPSFHVYHGEKLAWVHSDDGLVKYIRSGLETNE